MKSLFVSNSCWSMSDWQHLYTAANKLKQTYVSSSKISISDVPPINQVLWLVVTEQSGVTTTHVLPMGSALVWGQLYFLSSSVVSHTFSVLCAGYARIQRSGIIITPRLPFWKILFWSYPPLLSLPVEKNHVLNHSLIHLAYLIRWTEATASEF